MFERNKSAFARTIDGLKAPLRGADFLLRHPTLMRYAMAPFLLSFILLSVILWVTVDYALIPIHDKLVTLLHLSGLLLKVFEIVVWPAAFIAYAFLASFVFTALANLLAGPFNDRLSLRTEEIVSGKEESSVFSFGQAIRQLGASMLVQLKKISFFVTVQILLLGIWLVPLVQLAYPILAGLVTIWFLATEFLDYPMERRNISYRMRLLFCWNHRYEILGFGSSVALWLLIPIVGFVALPVSVVGGTLLYLKAIEG